MANVMSEEKELFNSRMFTVIRLIERMDGISGRTKLQKLLFLAQKE